VSGRLRGKIAAVTGAGRGIGREYALALAREGADVIVNDLVEADGSSPAEAVAAELRDLGVRAAADHADVTDPDAVQAMFGRAEQELGGLDIVIANAGILSPSCIADMPGDRWARVIAVHLNGTFNCIHNAIPHLRRRGGGSIVTTGSLATELLFPGLAAYRSAKAAIVVLTNYAAAEFRGDHVNVNSIMPGGTVTRMSDQFYASLGEGNDFLHDPSRREQQDSGDDTPPAAPADTVPPLGVYLCTEKARHITGHAFQLTGTRIGCVTSSSTFTFCSPDEEKWSIDALSDQFPRWLADVDSTQSQKGE
jgi:NAD(P)-dependent dehydrogenase (short-subunit alcohol dehydrogenase family)